MIRIVIPFVVLVSIWSVFMYALVGSIQHQQFDSFDQRNFPCQEDEALMYAPTFGPDKVGCIHLNEPGT